MPHTNTPAAARGTRAPREGRQPTARHSKANQGLRPDPNQYVFMGFPSDCAFIPGDTVQVAEPDTGEVYTGVVTPKAELRAKVLHISVLFEDNDIAQMVPIDLLTAVLTQTEVTELDEAESVIHEFKEAFVKTGKALRDIQTKRLYRLTHPSFKDYLKERWSLARGRAYELMDASDAALLVSEISDSPPLKESHAAELKHLDESELKVVWNVVQSMTSKKPTAADIKSVVEVFKEISLTGAIDNGHGESIPIQDAPLALVQAVVAETTYERFERHKGHIVQGAQQKEAKDIAKVVAKAAVGEIILKLSPRDKDGFIWLTDQDDNCISRMEYNPPFDVEMAKRLRDFNNQNIKVKEVKS